jgi:hypothetical protein
MKTVQIKNEYKLQCSCNNIIDLDSPIVKSVRFDKQYHDKLSQLLKTALFDRTLKANLKEKCKKCAKVGDIVSFREPTTMLMYTLCRSCKNYEEIKR